MNDEQEFVFLVPDVEAEAYVSAESEAGIDEREVGIGRVFRRAREASISRAELESFWSEKVVGLTETLAQAQAKKDTKGFRVDEISFSIGVGAKGGVMFVAEGSVEASMSVTLRRAE